jgi:CheY-like chemotaxis protein
MVSKILVVDDERSIAETMRDIFQSVGYRADCAYSGDEAIAKAADLCPDVLLSDVMMPGMNGFEVALQVKQLCPECRLMLFSGQIATALLAQGFVQTFTASGYHYELLSKPLHPSELIRRVQDALLRPG